MKSTPDSSRSPKGLRGRAEKALAKPGRRIELMHEPDVQGLAHDLQVHEIELEMQNEELRRTQEAFEAARDRFDACRQQSAQRIRQQCARRIQDGHVIQTRRSRRWRRTAFAFPRVQPDVVMVAASRNEGPLRAETLLQFKAEHLTIKFQRAFEIGHLKMNVADADTRINGLSVHSHNSPLKARRLVAATL